MPRDIHWDTLPTEIQPKYKKQIKFVLDNNIKYNDNNIKYNDNNPDTYNLAKTSWSLHTAVVYFTCPKEKHTGAGYSDSCSKTTEELWHPKVLQIAPKHGCQ